MAEYLNDFHKQNEEALMEYLRKQKPLSPEEMIEQYRRIHNLKPNQKKLDDNPEKEKEIAKNKK